MFYNHSVMECLKKLDINKFAQICQVQIVSWASRLNSSRCLEIIILFLEISLVPWAVSFEISTNVQIYFWEISLLPSGCLEFFASGNIVCTLG